MPKFNLVVTILVLTTVTCVHSNALDDYVIAPDAHYSYSYVTSYGAPGVTVHALNMTSQKWLTDAVTTNPVWFHQLYIIIPVSIDYTDTAFILIGEGSNTDSAATLSDAEIKRATVIASTTGSVTAVIKQIPNQPIVFQDDPQRTNRSEDAIMAWTWRKFFYNTSNADILLLLPMTKAVVRAMDTVSSYVSGLTSKVIDKFMVAGRSKRGWATWTTAAVDKRVIAIAPSVMDLLNMKQSLHHHYRSLGGWSFTLSDYYLVNITNQLDSPNFLLFQDVMDPLVYNGRYNIPKLIVTSSGDEFFLLDDSHYFFDQLQSPKYLRIFPNAGHSVGAHEANYTQTLADFYLHVLEKAQIPNVTWVISQTGYGGSISARTSQKPSAATVFYAETEDFSRRDFRFTIIDPVYKNLRPSTVKWVSFNATAISDLQYEADVIRPPSGWAAFFIEFTFPGVRNSTSVFTTEVNIIPDIFSFPECFGATCLGNLV